MEKIVDILRPVGKLERWSTARHNLSFYTNVGLTARYASLNSNPFTQEKLYVALETLISTHASLGITVLSEDTPTPQFARLRSINLEEVVSFVKLSVQGDVEEQREIDEILSEQHNNKFRDFGLPLWRVVVIQPLKQDDARGVDVAFIYHHAIGDGASGQAFHITLQRALNNPRQTEAKAIITPPNIPLLPPLESLVSLSTSIPTLVAKLWTRLWFQKPHPESYWCGTPIQIPLKNVFRTLVFSPDTVSALLVSCRREKTTVTAFMQALLAKSFFEVLPEHEPNPVMELSTTAAINLRRFIPDAGVESMGVFVSSISVTHARHEAAEVWDIARRCKSELEAAVASGTKNTDTGLLKYLDDYEKFFLSKLGQRRENSIEVSNLGAMKSAAADGGEWALKRLLFSQSASVTGCAVEFSAVSVVGGEMCVGVSVQEGVVEKEILDNAVERFRRGLEELAV